MLEISQGRRKLKRMRMRSAQLRVEVLQVHRPIKDREIHGHGRQAIRKSSSSQGYSSTRAIIRAGGNDPCDGWLSSAQDSGRGCRANATTAAPLDNSDASCSRQ
ncbi:hypothetical protein J3459_014673 [Metarhizium acridum]|uniref:uncharacterized protein n=1 Tax=Metarhizium acridum TaxID=92637 RepID=UPI001C6C649B|nr:hypothetical protein J3458_014358 [Metarhizium acridum]KAG8414416.1 hypothetical protein J3459_014757 [Metarhizium acridum]KAG8414513.1 hypothetical protein J3459_014673 [Metarhizium acridum]